MQLVLQPCSDSDARTHFVHTIETPVPISRILRFLPQETHAAIQQAFPDSVAIWGITPGTNNVNANKWRRMQPGDTVLLYRSKKLFFKATVAYKVHAPDLARELWSTKADGSTWEYVFFLTDLEPIDIDIERFNLAAKYKSTNIIQGFNVLPTSQSEEIAQMLGLDDGVGPLLPSQFDLEKSRETLRALEEGTDASGSAKRRKEQGLLRKLLLGGKSHAPCSICGRQLPVSLLVIGHIRRRSSCNHVQRLDMNNVMPVCLLGCDALFENGYLHVDPTGHIRSDYRIPPQPELPSIINDLIDRACAAWSTASAPYFEWHRTHRRRVD